MMNLALAALGEVHPVVFAQGLAEQLAGQSQTALQHVANPGQLPGHMKPVMMSIAHLLALPSGGSQHGPLERFVVPARQQLDELTQAATEATAQKDDALQELEATRQSLGTFTEDAESRVEELIDALGQRVEQAGDTAQIRVADDAEEFSRQATNLHAEGESLLKELRAKLRIAGDESLSGEYGNAAKREQRAVLVLRSLTVLAALLAIGIAAATAVGAESADHDTQTVLGRLGVVAVTGALATYLGRQANHHRDRGWQLQKVQLELSNLGSYLNELPDSRRAELRALLVPRYFTPEPLPRGDGDYAPTGLELTKQIRRTIAPDASSEAASE